MESEIIAEFMSRTGANAFDAVSCLRTWNWDIKRAMTDYNDTVTKEKSDKLDDNIRRENVDTVDSSALPVKRRPTLVKSDSIDIADYRKLSRGISRATDNINLVSLARTEIAKDFRTNCKDADKFNLVDTPDFTFILPNIFNYPDEFRTFLEKDLIECSTLSALEQSQCLNWWVSRGICKRLWPLATTGDGNCLLHAASLGIWGFHDRKLTLRSALYNVLSKGKCRDALWRRWRFQQTRFNKTAGFVYSEVEWAKEWDELVSMSSPEPRNNSKIRRRISASEKSNFSATDSIDDSAIYESLEEIHILALAHVLRRTIIVIADTVLRDLNGEAMAPITFGGIYFPFEVDAAECNRGPLLLAYDMAHFSALVPMESDGDNTPALIPLVSYSNVLLPIQFCIDPGENFNWRNYDGSEESWTLTEREQVALLKEYLDIIYVPNVASPEDEVYEDFTDDELDKKFSESEVIVPITVQLPDEVQTHKSNKATKQLQSVARQFGSIGKNMGKKLKKNIGSITRIGSKSNSHSKSKHTLSSVNSTHSLTFSRILCARLRIRRYDFQEEMIRNYLECARNRFLEFETNGHEIGRDSSDRLQFEMMSIKEAKPEENLLCINSGCNNIAKAENSYLCRNCAEDKRAFTQSALRYGTGKSKFYTQVDTKHHDNIRNLPPARKLNELDQTLYLSNSTFYNDQLPEPVQKVQRTNSTLHYSDYSPRVRLDEVDEIPIDSQQGNLNSSESRKSSLVNGSLSGSGSGSGSSSSDTSSMTKFQTTPCKTIGCIFYGTSSTNFYCSKCYQNECIKTSSSPSSDDRSSDLGKFQTTTKIYPTATAIIAKTNSKIMSDI